MTAILPPGARLQIGTVRIAAASGLAARQLADALPGALDRALAGQGGTGPADQVAAAIIARAAGQVEGGA